MIYFYYYEEDVLGTYLAGGYNRLKTEIAGRVVENEGLANMPNRLFTKFRSEGGNWFNLMSVEYANCNRRRSPFRAMSSSSNLGHP